LRILVSIFANPPPNMSEPDKVFECNYYEMKFVHLDSDASRGVFLSPVKKHAKKGRSVSVLNAEVMSRYSANLVDNTLSDLIHVILHMCELYGIGSVALDVSKAYTHTTRADWEGFLFVITKVYNGEITFKETSAVANEAPDEVELVRGMALIGLPSGWVIDPATCEWTGKMDESAKTILRSIFHSINISMIFSAVTGMTDAIVQNPYLCCVEGAKKYVTASLIGAGYSVRDECVGTVRISWAPAKTKGTKK
jgi:hypothetical protein